MGADRHLSEALAAYEHVARVLREERLVFWGEPPSNTLNLSHRQYERARDHNREQRVPAAYTLAEVQDACEVLDQLVAAKRNGSLLYTGASASSQGDLLDEELEEIIKAVR